MNRTIALLVALMTILPVAGQLSAQENVAPVALTGANKIGYVDVSRVFDDYSRTKQSKVELDKEIKLKEEKIREMETELRQLRADLDTKEINLTEEVKTARIKEKSDQIQAFSDQAEEELSKKESQLTENIVAEIYSMINSVGEKEGFSVIMDKGNIIYGHKGLDLTDRILKELEAKK